LTIAPGYVYSAAMKIDIPKHLAEFEARQQFRREVGLPLASKEAELRRIRNLLAAEKQREFEALIYEQHAELYRRAFRRVMYRRFKRPDVRSWFEGITTENMVRRLFRVRFKRTEAATALGLVRHLGGMFEAFAIMMETSGRY
jgi:hypothetical protein